MATKKSPRPLSEVDKATRERIEALTALQPHELSPADRAFMRGRADYLTEEQIADYCEAPEGEEEETGDEGTGEDGEDEVEEIEDYADLSLDELKAECEARGLTVEGRQDRKAPFVAALEADDEANPEG